MTWFQKRREHKLSAEFEDVKMNVEMSKSLGGMSAYVEVRDEVLPMVKQWCNEKGYSILIDHKTGNTITYKIHGWD